ncbi:MAG TPA: complex I subunit 1 family protein [Bryobacteraceae bacterium]|jgi:NADH-quinone oxidoreductase subunit H|nr:complex I subunit 1 family protein [Bryobacteraceae bacterium]
MNFFLVSLIKIALVFAVFMTTLAYLQWIERKVLGHIQARTGPLRVGPHGLMQPMADVFKLLTKEDLLPPYVNRFFYLLAPFIAVCLALISISIIPFGPEVSIFGVHTFMQITDVNVGILFVLAISSVSVYGIALAGWSSNNKYSLIGGLRSSAQMISYELPLTLAIVAPLLLANHVSFRAISDSQAGYYLGFIPRWSIFQMPFPQIFDFIIFMIAGFAETNRVPFDLPEAENELVAGFHTEYSSMKFACFFMSEYANMVTISCVATLLFLGGWHPLFPAPYSNWIPTLLFVAVALVFFFQALQPARRRDRITMPLFGVAALVVAAIFAVPLLQTVLVPIFWFVSKAGLILFTYIWVRGTLPRFRYDQLMHFAWTFLFPVALINLLVTAFCVAVF